jgi:hypothetical protein
MPTYTHVISSAVEDIKDVAGTYSATAQLILTFTMSDIDLKTALEGIGSTFDDFGFKVSDWGTLEGQFDFEDTLLVPGTYNVRIDDDNGNLSNLLFGMGDWKFISRKDIEIELKIDGVTEYEGIIMEDGIEGDVGNKTYSLSFDPGMKAITSRKIYIEDHDVSFDIGDADCSAGIVTVKTKTDHKLAPGCIVNIADVEGMTDLNDEFRILETPLPRTFTVALTTSQTYTADTGTVVQSENINPFDYIDSSPYPITELLEDIFKLVNPSISYAGGDIEIYQDWLFYGYETAPDPGHECFDIVFEELMQDVHPLYFNSAMGANTVGDVLRKLASHWGCFAGMIHKERAFFKKLGYFDPDNTQSIGLVLNQKPSYRFGLVDYVDVLVGNLSAFRNYRRGQVTQLEDRKFNLEVFPAFYFDDDGANYSNIIATVDRDPSTDDGSYVIRNAMDESIDAVNFHGNGYLLAEYWWKLRGTMEAGRVDNFEVVGLGFDPMLGFVYGGLNWEPIGWKKNIGNCTTEIDALFISEAEE